MITNIGEVQIERNVYHEAGHVFIHLLTVIELPAESIIKNGKDYDVVIHDNYYLIKFKI
jgi:hypothetical protein